PMPPLALKPSTAHCVARMPLSPGAAAMPERGARMPMRRGLFCAIAGANTPLETDAAPSAAADASSLRREIVMTPSHEARSLRAVRYRSDLPHDISDACQQQAADRFLRS